MDKYSAAIITGLVVFFVCAIAIAVMLFLFRKKKEEWKRIADDKYKLGKSEADEIIRNTIDQVEEDKSKLSCFSDRELLVEIMLALGSQGRRLDRIEDKTKCITDYQKYINEMNTLSYKLSLGFVTLENNMSLSNSAITELRQIIQETNTDIAGLIEALGDLKSLLSEFEHHTNRLKRLEQQVRGLEERINGILDEMNSIMAVNNQSPMMKLKTIETAIGNVATSISSLLETMDDLGRTASSIEENLGDHNDWRYGESLHARITRINELIEGIGESVEETLKFGGRNSLISKIDNISSEIWSLRNQLDS